ncbi:MAG: hypothetical protein WCO16_03735 [bacterium]
MSTLTTIGSIIILFFALLWTALSSALIDQKNILGNNIIVHDLNETKNAISGLISSGNEVTACKKLKASVTFGFSQFDVDSRCIVAFAKAKEDTSICKLETNSDSVDSCIRDIAVQTKNSELCKQILSDTYKQGCYKYTTETEK